jgi:hypothetical protein
MPVPKPKDGESKTDFMERCMHEVSKNPDRPNEQNVAICLSTWRTKHPSDKAPDEKKHEIARPVPLYPERQNR